VGLKPLLLGACLGDWAGMQGVEVEGEAKQIEVLARMEVKVSLGWS
jgi:hypothetical protein